MNQGIEDDDWQFVRTPEPEHVFDDTWIYADVVEKTPLPRSLLEFITYFLVPRERDAFCLSCHLVYVTRLRFTKRIVETGLPKVVKGVLFGSSFALSCFVGMQMPIITVSAFAASSLLGGLTASVSKVMTTNRDSGDGDLRATDVAPFFVGGSVAGLLISSLIVPLTLTIYLGDRFQRHQVLPFGREQRGIYEASVGLGYGFRRVVEAQEMTLEDKEVHKSNPAT